MEWSKHLANLRGNKVWNGKVVDEEDLVCAKCLIPPNNSCKLHWDMLVTALLLYSCFATPAQIALWDE